MGLGLAWVYGIVTNHRGGVAISSSPKQGASVRIYLPAMKKIIEENLVPDRPSKAQRPFCLWMTKRWSPGSGLMVLSSVGYKVLTAHNGGAGAGSFCAEQRQD